jgi:hypothetical protein
MIWPCMGSGNIHAFGQFCKVLAGDFVRERGLIVAIILVGLASFGLGRLSGLDSAKQPISISQTASAALPASVELGGSYVASRRGSVYYFPWCGVAANIDPKDQVWFKTKGAAEKAGYQPAKNCRGLGDE